LRRCDLSFRLYFTGLYLVIIIPAQFLKKWNWQYFIGCKSEVNSKSTKDSETEILPFPSQSTILYRPILFPSPSVFACLVESFRCNPPGVTSRSINAMTQVCVFPGHSSVRRSASSLRWPPARSYELCPQICLLRHGQDRAKKLDSAYVNQRQPSYFLQNKFRLNRRGCVRDLRFSQRYVSTKLQDVTIHITTILKKGSDYHQTCRHIPNHANLWIFSTNS
jgi:hypothetical protein